jgi:hypothetical protein
MENEIIIGGLCLISSGFISYYINQKNKKYKKYQINKIWIIIIKK